MTTPSSTPPLSPARRAGEFLYLSGQLPRTEGGGMVGGDIRDQTRQVIENMRRVLAAHGADLGHVVKTTVWLTDKAHLAGFNETYREMFDTPYPARSTVVSGLVADADIEIEAVAYVPSPD